MTPHCPECQAPLYAGGRICGYCGAPVAAERQTFATPAPPPRVNDMSAQQTATPPATSTTRVFFVVFGLAAVFGVAVGGALVGARLARERPGGEEERARVSNGLVSNGGGAAANTSTPAPTRAPSPRPTRERPAQYPSPAPSAPSGRYLVLLGAYGEIDGARARLDYVRASGNDARIVDSDDYPNMTPGLWLVVVGPYEKSYADAKAAELRAVVPDAYAKSGW
jgi:cell division septation protein DedD